MAKSICALVVGAALLVVWPSVSLPAQDAGRMGAGPSHPRGLDVASEWRYSCPSGKGCSFTCPGAGGASSVSTLSLYLATIPLSDNQRAVGVFYEFSTTQIQRANGFSITTGISTLSCQVNGMNLDYSGPPDTPTTGSTSERR
jgi:hypothetical protein